MNNTATLSRSLPDKFRDDTAIRGRAGLGSVLGGALGQMVLGTASTVARHQLTLVQPAAPAVPGEFPCGVEARVVDECGRLRPQFRDGQVRDLLGWDDGVLATTLINGWLVLTQRPEHVGAKRGRCSDKAGFTLGAGGTERIALRPAHLMHLDAAPGTLLLLAAIPAERAVVIVNPALLASIAPPHVRPLLGVEPARHLAAVAETDDVLQRDAR